MRPVYLADALNAGSEGEVSYMGETLVAEAWRLAGLTQEEIAARAGTSRPTVSVARWSAGESSPQPDARRRLLELRYVADAVAEVIRTEDVNLWMFEPHKLLDGDTPAERIRKGQYKDVLAVIEALAEGVVV